MTLETAVGAADGESPTPAIGKKSEPSDSQDLILKVAAAVGTGVGVLGFVTLFGGAILWIRAERANLPANDAVSVIPNNVLVTTGASFLVPAVLLALLAVTVIFLFHLSFLVPRKARERRAFEHARELLHKAKEVARQADAKTQRAQAVRAQATSLSDTAEQLKQDPSVPEGLETAAESAADSQRLEAEKAEAEALALTSQATEMRAAADNLQAASEFALKRSHGQFLTELGVGAVMLLVLPPIFNQALFHVAFFWSGLILIGVAGVATAISLVTYVTTEKFVWFGVVAFLTVGVYIGFATFFNTIGNPKVEPAAALRSDRPPVIGIYIADTTSNLYLGTFPESGKPSRLMVIPRTQVTDLAIGPLLDRETARQRAVEIALEECRMKVSTPKTTTATASVKPACSKAQYTALASTD
jgi:hypothetical protein